MNAARSWNRSHPIGTRVRYWPGARTGEGREAVTRSEAWTLGSGDAVVAVTGYPGGIALTHVQCIEPHNQACALQ